MSGTKVLLEFHSKFVPVKELGISSVFFFPPENSSHPFGHPSRFHVRQGPGDFYLVGMKGVGTKVHICLDRIKKACPLDLSPLNSVGNAGGGGRPAGMVGMSVGTFFCSDTILSSCLNLIINLSNCFLVSSSLSCELASVRGCYLLRNQLINKRR